MPETKKEEAKESWFQALVNKYYPPATILKKVGDVLNETPEQRKKRIADEERKKAIRDAVKPK